uniref:apyrase n=1 Tax=Timema bartmani TaxID=61472 RepID=A0A7R9EV40_9NEOP|nr:unnamed protein product [Timema bartmani]
MSAMSLSTLCLFYLTFAISALDADDRRAQRSRRQSTDAKDGLQVWSSGNCPKGQEASCVGGIARLYTAIDELVARRPNAIFLNAGDNFQGTLWYTLFKWNLTLEFMNLLPHDAMTLGNHEFDDKLAGVIPFIKGLNCPVVVANIDDSLEPRFQGLYNKSVVIERDGRKIGIVGYIIKTVNELSSTEKLMFLDEVEAVRSESARLKSQGVDIIIALSHAGYGTDLVVAAEVPDIDVIVGGHSHTLLYTGTLPGGDIAEGPYPTMVTQASGKMVPVVQAYAFSKYLGNLTVWFDQEGEPVAWEGNPILMNQSFEENGGILEKLSPWMKEVSAKGDVFVGTTKYVDKASNGSWTYATIAIHNAGGFRSSIEETNYNEITFNDLVTCTPFLNTIDTLELQGRDLLQVLEKSVSNPFNSTASGGFNGKGFLQYADTQPRLEPRSPIISSLVYCESSTLDHAATESGLNVVYNLTRPIGERVVEVEVLCAECRVPQYQPLSLDTWYRIATSSYLAGGGDGYKVFEQNSRNHNIGRLDLEVFQDYIKKNSPIIQGLEGRIIIIRRRPVGGRAGKKSIINKPESTKGSFVSFFGNPYIWSARRHIVRLRRFVEPGGTTRPRLSLIHWNDFHARFEQTGWAGGSCPANDNSSCVGGVARVATAIKDLKARYPHSVFLNAGDVFQGTLWYTLFRWNATVKFMNMLPHDAMTLGNHEFDNGLEGIIPFMEQANFPIVVANIDDSEEPDFQGLYNKSIVIEREGRKIGIVGYLLNSTHVGVGNIWWGISGRRESQTVDVGNIWWESQTVDIGNICGSRENVFLYYSGSRTIASTENLRFLGEVETVTREVSVLKEQGADIIIALSHCGLQADKEVASVVPGLDIIVGGHSHTLLYNGTAPRNDTTGGTYPIVVHQDDGRQVLIVQTGANSKYLGHLLVHFDSGGEVVSWSGNPILMDQSIQPDPEIVAELEPFRQEVEKLGSMPIGSTRVRLSRPCSLGECSLGNMITDAMVEEYVALAPENAWTYAAIAMMNSGGIRAEISELNDGVILFNDLATAQPFQNTVDTLELEGHVLLQVIELSAARPFSSRSYLISDPEELTRDARVFSGYGFLQYSGECV